MLDPKVVYKTEDFLVLDKPAGLLVHAVPGHPDAETLVSWLRKNWPQVEGVGDDPYLRPGIVHRLDKDTSGLMLVALNQKTFDYLKRLFGSRGIKKTYLALVYGAVKEKSGTIEKTIGLKSGSVKRTVWLKSAKDLKPALTSYRLEKTFHSPEGIFSLLSVTPQTGRTHQIRVHLASIGHPVVGDGLYGARRENLNLGRQFLHAAELEFRAASGEAIRVSADLPPDLKSVLGRLEERPLKLTID